MLIHRALAGGNNFFFSFTCVTGVFYASQAHRNDAPVISDWSGNKGSSQFSPTMITLAIEMDGLPGLHLSGPSLEPCRLACSPSCSI